MTIRYPFGEMLLDGVAGACLIVVAIALVPLAALGALGWLVLR